MHEQYKGEVEDTRVYNRNLSECEIQVLSNCCQSEMKSVGQLKNIGDSKYWVCRRCGKKCSPKVVECDQNKLESLKYPKQGDLLEFV